MKYTDVTEKFTDQNLYRAFLGSAFLGIGSFALPVIAPVALAGMIGSQAIFWTKQMTKDSDVTEE